MIPRAVLGVLFVSVCWITSGCSIQPTPMVGITQTQPAPEATQPPEYLVNRAEPTKGKSSLEDQEVEIRNCDGKTEHNPLSAHAQVAQSVTIGDTADSIESGDSFAVNPEIKVMLTEKVQQTYQQIYDEARATVEQNDLRVPSGSISTYTIYWAQQTISSTISCTQNGHMYSIPYVYVLDIPKSIIKMQTGCTG